LKACRRLEHFTIKAYAPNKTKIEKLQEMTTIIPKERILYTTICSKKDMSIKLQGVRAPKIQP
jgi:hypothetical protein